MQMNGTVEIINVYLDLCGVCLWSKVAN